MAIWKKTLNRKQLTRYSSKNKYIEIINSYGKNYYVLVGKKDGRSLGSAISYGKTFKTKKGAENLAKRFMKKH